MNNVIRFGADQACKLITMVQGDQYHSYCDKYVYPQQYDKTGVYFWLSVAGATLVVVLLVRRLVSNAFDV